jgi:signal transduction histidine kinase
MSTPAGHHHRRILVIDDNRAIHEDFRKILVGEEEVEGYNDLKAELFGDTAAEPTPAAFEVDSAFQGEEGLDRVRQAVEAGRPYAMAFIDVRMPPGWDGIETTTRIWEVSPDLQVVICTAYSDYSWDEMIAKVGQSDRLVILKKPFDNIEALQLANALTEKWRLIRQARTHIDDLERVVAARTAELETLNRQLQADIKKRDLMEVQLRQAQKLESIGQLAAGIAHEINTPIQYVGDNTRFIQDAFADVSKLLRQHESLLQAVEQNAATPQLISEVKSAIAAADVTYLEKEIPKAAAQTLEGVERVTRIVRAMKDFSHPGASEKTTTNLNKAIESTLMVSRNEWKYVAEMVTDFDPNLPSAPCLPGEFNQVILNLVINAAHAITDVVGSGATAKGTITVSTRRCGELAEIRIRDTGPGIPEKIRERIFDPFFTTKGVGKGTGQGLAIAHSVIVERHGGRLLFETEVGKGTTFVIQLPLHSHTPPIQTAA